jgi:hypothetical protein
VVKDGASVTEKEQDRRWIKLWREVPHLSASAIESLEQQLQIDKMSLEPRVKLLLYYSEYEGNVLKHKHAEQKLFEQVLWLIENRPSVSGFLRHVLTKSGRSFKPKAFGILRQAWLKQVAKTPLEGSVLGNAAMFIVWNDIETASDLFERAHSSQPSAAWLETFAMFCHFDLWNSPNLYKNDIRERTLDVGIRSLMLEHGGAPFLTCEYVCESALSLGRLDIVRWCAEILRNWNETTCVQLADAYMGLVALRENDRDLAVQLMLEMRPGYQPQAVVLRLASELFALGERDSIVELITGFKGKIRKSVRDRWLRQIANNEPPDFDDFCC